MAIDKDGFISIRWHVDDVKRRAKELGIKISDQQAKVILELVERNHDATIGVTWETFDWYLED